MITDKDRAEVQAMLEAVFCLGVPIALSDDDVRRWLAVRDHVLAAHECPTVPVWRPTTAAEIQAGWEVRSRHSNGFEATWGVAHHRDDEGDWRTEAGAALTYASRGWNYETTAPLPEPEPWDEGLVMVLAEVICNEPGTVDDEARAVLDALAARGYLDRAAITGGEQA